MPEAGVSGTAQEAGTAQDSVSAWRRSGALLLGIGLLAVCVALSLAFGSRSIPLAEVWSLLFQPDGSEASGVLHDLRVPRTVLAVVVGAALALAGAVMQALTRNPLADPGILGINAGATLAVVVAVAITGTSGVHFYMWFACLGAAVAAVLVYTLGASGRGSQTPTRLALAGVAISAALVAITQTVILADQEAFNEFRYWVSGSLEGRTWDVLHTVLPLVVVGLAIALLIAPALDVLSLGEETARALGVRVERAKWLSMAAVALLCGAATAAVGPIGFVGLAVPLLARRLVGPNQRWIAAVCLVVGPAWVLLADTASRVVLAPQEVPAGAVAALIGAPVFIALCTRAKVSAL